MSKEAVENFLQAVGQDPALQAKMQSEANAKDDPVGYIVEMAAQQGHVFTAEEFLATCASAEGPLSDHELESVAGGARPKFIVLKKGAS